MGRWVTVSKANYAPPATVEEKKVASIKGKEARIPLNGENRRSSNFGRVVLRRTSFEKRGISKGKCKEIGARYRKRRTKRVSAFKH